MRSTPAAPPPAPSAAETPLDWLRRHKTKGGKPWINQVQYEAGQRLAQDFQIVQMAQRTTMSWSPTATIRRRRETVGSRVEPAERALQSSRRLSAALHAVGPELAGVLIDVCCYERGLKAAEQAAGWPTRSGKVVLRLGLDALARHYGLLGPNQDPARSRIFHWGSKDYRPTITEPSSTDEALEPTET